MLHTEPQRSSSSLSELVRACESGGVSAGAAPNLLHALAPCRHLFRMHFTSGSSSSSLPSRSSDEASSLHTVMSRRSWLSAARVRNFASAPRTLDAQIRLLEAQGVHDAASAGAFCATWRRLHDTGAWSRAVGRSDSHALEAASDTLGRNIDACNAARVPFASSLYNPLDEVYQIWCAMYDAVQLRLEEVRVSLRVKLASLRAELIKLLRS